MRRTRSPKPGTPEWNAERKLAIFATDAAATAGLSKFTDPHTLYLTKLGLTAPQIELERMKWGKILEPIIAKEWAREHKVKIVPQQRWTFWRDDLPYPMATHLDFTVGDGYDAILEIKTAGSFASADFGEEGTDQVPKDYLLQCVHEMAVVGAKRCHLVVLIGGNQLRSYVIERDPDLEAALIQREYEAWEGIQRKEPPPIDGSEGATEFLRIVNGSDDGTEIELDDEVRDLALSALAAAEQRKVIEGQEAEIRNRLKEIMGKASVGRGGDVQLTYRQNKPSLVVDWPMVAHDLAEDVMRHHPQEGATLLSTLAAYQKPRTVEKPGARPLLIKFKES